MKYILSIDQGTTGSRAVVYDKQARIITSAYQEFRQYFPRPGWVEHDPEDIWRSVNASIQKVLNTIPSGSIAAIGITNQRETTVVWDRLTGKPVYNAIVWQCRRTASRCGLLKRQKETYIKKITGLPVDAYFSATKIEWILRNVPGTAAKARKGAVCFGTTDSWILWKLTAGKVHATDHTNASRTMLFNIRDLSWDPVLLNTFKIPRSILPQVRASSGTFGVTARIGKLTAGIPISGIAGDQQAALFGQACFASGSIKNTYGTGAFILLNTGRTMPRSRFGLITTLACGSSGEPVYALEGSVFIAGAAIQWLRDGLQIVKSAKDSGSIAARLKNNEGVYFVPALSGLGAPYWDQHARGTILGITRVTKREHLVRAALEAMCYQTKDVIDAMRKDTGLKIQELKVDGGAAVNDFLLQFQADILDAAIVRPRVTETTSLGAAYLAGLAVGYWESASEIARYWKKARVFHPRMPSRERQRLCEGWRNAVSKTLT